MFPPGLFKRSGGRELIALAALATAVDIIPCELYRVPVQEEGILAIRTTYTQARANLAKLCDEATGNREVVIISRRSGEDVALVAASELAGLAETAHLLRSPKNAQRLLKALEQAKSGVGKPETVDELRRDLGLDSEE
jgi:antitoxin YefM